MRAFAGIRNSRMPDPGARTEHRGGDRAGSAPRDQMAAPAPPLPRRAPRHTIVTQLWRTRDPPSLVA
jgi:hypothetical protein